MPRSGEGSVWWMQDRIFCFCLEADWQGASGDAVQGRYEAMWVNLNKMRSVSRTDDALGCQFCGHPHTGRVAVCSRAAPCTARAPSLCAPGSWPGFFPPKIFNEKRCDPVGFFLEFSDSQWTREAMKPGHTMGAPRLGVPAPQHLHVVGPQ